MKTLKITLIALLGLSLATVSCKKEAAPEQQQQQQSNNNGGNGSGNGSGNSTDTTNNNSNDSLITFIDLVDNVSADSTIVFDTSNVLSNTIQFVSYPTPLYANIDIYTANNGGMTSTELMTSGVYDNKLSGINIYNEATLAWEDYTLVSTASHGLIINATSSEYRVAIAGTFVNANGDTVVIPWVELTNPY